MDAGDTAALLDLTRKLQAGVGAKFGRNDVTVASRFEAGRDGFWLHSFPCRAWRHEPRAGAHKHPGHNF
jgi:hypothetical protein